MSIRAVVDRLAGAKRQLEQARTIGNQAAEGISVAKCALDDALDGVQDKLLSTDTAAQAKALADEVRGIEALHKGIDDAVRRAQGIGSQRR
jgi:hypothetical protein